jgi:hypothetical protein
LVLDGAGNFSLHIIHDSLLNAPSCSRSCAPNLFWLRLIYAHALLFNANITATLNLHRAYYGRMRETGESWGAARPIVC